MKIKMIEKFGNGWIFSVDGINHKTNQNGYGLWVEKAPGEWKQTEGTCQFSLPLDRKKAYDKIRYEFRAMDDWDA